MMKIRIGNIKVLTQRKSVRQIASLFSVNLIGIPLGIVTNIIVTKYLGAQLFGDYKFIQSVFNFAILFFTFGFFQAGNRAIVLSNDRDKTREYYGSLFIIMTGIFIIMSVGLSVYVFFDSNIIAKGLSKTFITILPLGFLYLWSRFYEVLLPADNQIGLLSKMRLYPRVLNLLGACIIYYFLFTPNSNKLYIVLILYSFTQLLTYLFVIFKIKPTFRNIKGNLHNIWLYNKSFGFNVYLGSLFAVGFANLTEILISYFGADNTGVGYYSLAVALSQPLSFIPSTIATTHYKSFATDKKISKKLVLLTMGLSVFSMVALWVVVPPFIIWFYGESFKPVITINFFVCIGVMIYGLSDFYNRFLGAHGKGKELRNASFIVGLGALFSNIIFIPPFGEYGAAYAKIMAGAIYLLVIIYYYKKTVKSIS